MEIKIFNALPNEARQIREAVFVDEQGFSEEYGKDDDASVHFLLFKNGKAVATMRAFPEENNSYHIGRVAVLKSHRKQGLGEKMYFFAEKHIKSLGAEKITVSAQKRAIGFYEKLGFEKIGKEYLEEGYPHQYMEKDI